MLARNMIATYTHDLTDVQGVILLNKQFPVLNVTVLHSPIVYLFVLKLKHENWNRIHILFLS